VSERWQAMETGGFMSFASTIAPEATEHHLLCGLARTQLPILLIYGEADPYCPVSHAQAAFNALKTSSPQTELVVYSQDDHWLRQASHLADANFCVCKWMLRHMPVAPLK
jgi:predicted esterase